ncbi:hypothetical protein PS1_029580 [Malus domestica]
MLIYKKLIKRSRLHFEVVQAHDTFRSFFFIFFHKNLSNIYLRTTLLKSESSGESPSEFVLKSRPKLLEDGREVHSFDKETYYYFSIQDPDSNSSRLQEVLP